MKWVFMEFFFFFKWMFWYLSLKNELGIIPLCHTASLLYPGSACWKVWMLHTSLSKQIDPAGKVWGNTGKHQHLWKRAPIGGLKDGLYCAAMAAPSWSTTNVGGPCLFSFCERSFIFPSSSNSADEFSPIFQRVRCISCSVCVCPLQGLEIPICEVVLQFK